MPVRKVSCPSCGAEASLRAADSVFTVCEFCRSMLVRHDDGVEDIGKMASLSDDLSPLQIGTVGQFKGKLFTLIGRAKIGWEAGFWNEWHAYFDDGRTGWLAEAQGFYMMSFVNGEHQKELPEKGKLKAGHHLRLKGREYLVDDIKSGTCIASEGELPFKAVTGRESLLIDMSDREGVEFGTIDYSSEGVVLYLGQYVPFDEFNFKNLRKLDGW